ncbi:MAG TPA: malto-oligosyltrehalose trehalohydrolase [Chthoniobacterales bacterium]|jgi:maltooligosyltrehalose trehalohydrolase
MIFEIWAPFAKSLELVLDSGGHQMTAGDRGWWGVEVPEAGPGTRYKFRIDSNGPFPDPRSLWQPDGVHGSSVVIDHAAFAWPDTAFRPKPLGEAVIYELHIGTFTWAGTYAAAAEKLAHLRDLGVTHVELLPLATFPGERGWGYDGAAIYAPHPAYGTPDDLKHFIQQAHALGLAVLLDVVYNHLGPDGNYTGAFGPYFTDRVKTPWGSALNFDGDYSDEVRAFFIENALMWLRDYRFDGLRLDAVHAIHDESAIHILEQMAERVAELSAVTGRSLILIAESDLNNPRFVHPIARGGYGLDAHWEDDFHHALHAFLTKDRDGYYADFGSLAQVAKALEQGYVFDGQYSPFRHRAHGRPPIDVAPHQLVVCAQNHDQTGNRALGDRLTHLLDPAGVHAAAALLLLCPFVPMLFQGEEWGASTSFQFFTDHNEELGRAVTEGRRHEFAAFDWDPESVPDPQARETFEYSKLRWDEIAEPAHRALLDWHRDLLAIRREIPVDALADVRFDEAANWLTLQRGNVVAAFNFADQSQPIPLPFGDWLTALAFGEIGAPRSTVIFRRA